MSSINWKKIVGFVLGLILLISFLAILSEISLLSIQTTFYMNLQDINLREAKDTYLSWLPKGSESNVSDEILKQWKEAWNQGGAPNKRIVNVLLEEDNMAIDYSFEIASDHPVAELVLTNQTRTHPQVFVESVFGFINFQDQERLTDKDFQPPSIRVDIAHDTITAHYFAIKKIAPDASFFLIRDASVQTLDLHPALDQVIINYSDRRLAGVYPLPSESTETTVIFEATSPDTVDQMGIETQIASATLPTEAPPISSISRQTLLLTIGGLLNNIPFLSNILGGVLEVLPLLLFLILLPSWQGEKLSILLRLKDVIVVLLIFHFAYYVVGGMANLFSTVMNRFGLVATLNLWLFELLSEVGVNGYYGFNFLGFYVVQTIIVGVLLPAKLLRHSRECAAAPEGSFFTSTDPLGRNHVLPQGGKRFPWGLILTVLFFVLAVGIPIFMGDQILHSLQAYHYDAQVVGVSLFFLSVFGVTGLLGLVVLRGIYGYLDGKPESPSIIAIAFWLLLAGNLIWSFTFIAIIKLELYSESLYSGALWFVYSTVLGTILVYAFVHLVHAIFAQAGWIGTLTRPVQTAMLAFAVFMAMPMRLLFSNETSSADYYEVLRLAAQLDGLIGPVFLAGLLWYFYAVGRHTRKDGPELKQLTLSVGLIAALLILYPSSAHWLYIPVTFLIGYAFLSYYILPAEHWKKKKLKQLYARVFHKRNAFLEEIVSLNTAERSYQGLYKTWSQKMSEGEVSYEQFKQKIDERRQELDKSNENARVEGQPVKDIALAFGPFETPWQNGIHGAFWAAIFALPWMLIWLFDFMKGEAVSAPYPLWSFFSDLLNLVISWVGIGFLFGYFYPYLRGKDGLQKGLWLWLVAVLPAIPLALLDNNSAVAWQGFLFWILQMFIHCMLLGLIAFDYMTLRQGYRDWQMLFELHGIPSVGLSISSILLAVGTAVTALFQTQTQAIIKTALTFIIPNADKFINLP